MKLSAIAIGLLVVLPGLSLGANQNASLVLHAVPWDPAATCSTPQDEGFNCDEANTQVDAGTNVDIFVYVVDADSLAGIALRFDWAPSWTLMSWRASCHSGIVEAMLPEQSGDSYVAAFDCTIPGGEGLVPIGWFSFTTGDPGTFLTIGEAPGGGTEIVACNVQTTGISPDRWGSIGVATPGVDGCNTKPTGWGGGGLIN